VLLEARGTASDVVLNADVNCKDISIIAADDVNQNADVSSGGGTILISAANGTVDGVPNDGIHMASGTSTTTSGGGNIRLEATAESDILLSLVNAGFGLVSLLAERDILDNNGTAVNVHVYFWDGHRTIEMTVGGHVSLWSGQIASTRAMIPKGLLLFWDAGETKVTGPEQSARIDATLDDGPAALARHDGQDYEIVFWDEQPGKILLVLVSDLPASGDRPPDTDGDGILDDQDAFVNDPAEWADSDGDGVGDNGDAFPDDSTEWIDSDGDGIGDNNDAFPNEPDQGAETNGDGTGDNSEALPDDPTVINTTANDHAFDTQAAILAASSTDGIYVREVDTLTIDVTDAIYIQEESVASIPPATVTDSVPSDLHTADAGSIEGVTAAGMIMVIASLLLKRLVHTSYSH
jgi:hypothetical protein